ncbi:mannitol dehydrogenase family protein [Dermabacter vaginalis]|uniref:Mannitol dehydrogenase family protein n=1 Tax=Dermabacter vaginalis TaxID=1630135 RepID=A0ABX6A5Y8_9MICO|nr:mannitol dehydrogenase family protein [Dermabacter vaginalis]MCG7443881.1 mannitol dehydrogenase family protein [Dermabacter vaginalis]QEU12543.1 mannitol dehydrogenase family protein [Dermabacter vaginalis]
MTVLSRDADICAKGGLEPRPVRIVHLGLGAFFRAHQAWYTSEVDPEGAWGISAYTGRSPRAAEELSAQDCLYTLIVRGAEGDDAQVMSVISEAHAAGDLEALCKDLRSPDVSLVTLTVTEAGYGTDAKGKLDRSNNAVKADVDALEKYSASEGESGPDASLPHLETALARLVLGLDARRRAGAGAITIVPCDNLPGNGPLTRGVIDEYAACLGSEAAAWIKENVSVTSTSIDRITPKATDDDREAAEKLTGLEDASPVVTEPFASWIIEGEFVNERPEWEKAGAIFTDDLEPYENRKLWLLNGAHTLLANAAVNRGYETVAEAIGDSEVRTEVEALWGEASRYLPDFVEADAYCEALLERFENPNIKHLLSQIGNDSLAKLRIRILPIALKELEAGRGATGAVPAIAGWIRRQRDGVASPDAQQSAIDEAVAKAGDAGVERALLELLEPELMNDAEFVERVLRAV